MLRNNKTPPPNEENEQSFIDLVQSHERSWGTTSYPDRPTLAQFLEFPVVAWWRSDKADDNRLRATVYKDLDELEKYMERILLHSRLEMPTYRLAMIHLNQKKAAIRGVRLNIIALDSDK